jgi:hypothetical protein
VNTGCLTEETVADYLEERLTDEERSRVESHLAQCDACLEELIAARGALQSDILKQFQPVPRHVTEKAIKRVKALEDRPLLLKISKTVKEKFSEWTEPISGLWPGYNLSLATVRGSKKIVSDDMVLIKKSFSGFNAEVEIEKTGPDKATIRVRVKEKDVKGPHIRVSLLKDGRELSSYLGTVSGIIFEDIPFGHYVLTFTRNGSKIGEYLFEIKEGRHDRK